MITDFWSYCKAIVTKQHVIWHKNRHVDQWNRVEKSKVHPYSYGHLTFDKDIENIEERKKNKTLELNGVEESGCPHISHSIQESIQNNSET